VLNARIVLTGPRAVREIAFEDLFSGNGKIPLRLKAAEILSEVVIPAEAMDGRSSYTKFANRESIDFPIVGAACWASKQTREYRVAFTAVDRKPLRGRKLETFLKGKDLTDETVDEAANLATKEAKPVKTSIYSPSFKRKMMGLLIKKALSRAMRRSA
jgi:xanthine dehydrogenase YagS FAD-binding subunit